MYLHKDLLNSFLACVLAFCQGFLLHMPIQVDKTTYFQPISCMYSIRICQVALELYCSYVYEELISVIYIEDISTALNTTESFIKNTYWYHFSLSMTLQMTPIENMYYFYLRLFWSEESLDRPLFWGLCIRIPYSHVPCRTDSVV